MIIMTIFIPKDFYLLSSLFRDRSIDLMTMVIFFILSNVERSTHIEQNPVIDYFNTTHTRTYAYVLCITTYIDEEKMIILVGMKLSPSLSLSRSSNMSIKFITVVFIRKNSSSYLVKMLNGSFT